MFLKKLMESYLETLEYCPADSENEYVFDGVFKDYLSGFENTCSL